MKRSRNDPGSSSSADGTAAAAPAAGEACAAD